MYCAARTQLASAAALGRLSRASSPVSGGPWRPTALRRAPAAELRLPSSRSAAKCVVAQPRGSTVARRAARRCILAAAGADDDNAAADSSDGDAFAADEAEPVLAPQMCTLLLKKLYGKVLGLRRVFSEQILLAQAQLATLLKRTWRLAKKRWTYASCCACAASAPATPMAPSNTPASWRARQSCCARPRDHR